MFTKNMSTSFTLQKTYMYRHFRTDERLTAVLKMTVAILQLKKADFYKYFNVKYSLFACNCQNNV